MRLSKTSRLNLQKQLLALGFKNYNEFLGSTLWRSFKNQIKKHYDCSRCRMCGSTKVVSFHHISYRALLNPANIAILCSDCHSGQHEGVSIQYGIKKGQTLAKSRKDVKKLLEEK